MEVTPGGERTAVVVAGVVALRLSNSGVSFSVEIQAKN
jgi:hypothetical protein